MSNEAAGLLKHFLEQRQLAGQTHIVLAPGMLDRLKHHGKTKPPAQPAAAIQRPAAAQPMTMEPARPQPVARTQAPAGIAAAHVIRKAAAPKTAISLIEVSGANNAEKLAALAAMAESDPKPRSLGTLRDSMVFAVGNPEAEIMLIGEAPGFEEERQREPFVGPAGQKLTGILTAMGLKRSDVYISNICKFRPGIEGNQGTSNRAPSEAEMNSCLPYILTEIAIIAPKVIIALGATATIGLGIGKGVTTLRGKFYEVAGIPTMVTYHPSYILREEKLAGNGLRAKREVWEDMLKVMEKVGLPISDKQRSYFKK